MITFVQRRTRAISLSIVLALSFMGTMWLLDISLRGSTYASGYVLLTLLVVLMLFNVRKKLPFLPLCSASSWLQFHVYAGLLSIVVFLAHTGFRWPSGVLESSLACFYWGVALSGVVGIFLSRAIPPRLNIRGEEVIFERIPVYHRRLRDQVQKLVLASVVETEAKTISDFHNRTSADFFNGPRHFWSHLLQSTRPRHEILKELSALDRYLNDREREISRSLAELIEAKDNLDYQWTMQWVLKRWLFVHIPLTYGMMIIAVIHAILAHAFFGGLR